MAFWDGIVIGFVVGLALGMLWLDWRYRRHREIDREEEATEDL